MLHGFWVFSIHTGHFSFFSLRQAKILGEGRKGERRKGRAGGKGEREGKRKREGRERKNEKNNKQEEEKNNFYKITYKQR